MLKVGNDGRIEGCLAVFSFRPQRIAIDLGTANTIVFIDGQGIVYKEPSVVARTIHTGDILGVGNQALELVKNQPAELVASRPMKEGVVTDYDTTVHMLQYFLKKASKFALQKPYVMICVPSSITEVEKRAVMDAARAAGAKETFLIEEPFAAAIGAKLPVHHPVGNMVVDIGGGTTDVAILSLGGIVTSQVTQVAGDAMDEAIIQYIKKKFKLTISDKVAEELKIAIGTASLSADARYGVMSVKGRDVDTGMPRQIRVMSEDLAEALQKPVEAIINTIKRLLEEAPPEISADVISHGIIMTGGGALLRDFDRVVADVMRLPVRIAENPMDCVVIGTGKSLETINQLIKRRYQEEDR